MEEHYLITCRCDAVHRVTTRQAGQTIACPCGAQLDVPTLRGLRQLPRETTDHNDTVSWSFARGILFAVGLIFAVGGGAGAGLFHWRFSQLDQHLLPRDREHENVRQIYQAATAAESWQAWRELSDDPFRSRQSQRAIAEQILRHYQLIRASFLVAAMLGLGLLAISTLGRRAAARSG